MCNFIWGRKHPKERIRASIHDINSSSLRCFTSQHLWPIEILQPCSYHVRNDGFSGIRQSNLAAMSKSISGHLHLEHLWFLNQKSRASRISKRYVYPSRYLALLQCEQKRPFQCFHFSFMIDGGFLLRTSSQVLWDLISSSQTPLTRSLQFSRFMQFMLRKPNLSCQVPFLNFHIGHLVEYLVLVQINIESENPVQVLLKLSKKPVSRIGLVDSPLAIIIFELSRWIPERQCLFPAIHH